MGLFNKKQKEEDIRLPELPDLPELPEFPEMNDMPRDSSKMIHQLPSFPNNSLGDKFSQNTIKEAISGREEDDFEAPVDEFEPLEEMKMIQEPLRSRIMPKLEQKPKEIIKEEEPLFVRLDKFEESHNILEELKKQINEISHLLNETNQLKEKEDLQLKDWGTKLQNIKQKVERIDKDLFSKL